MNISFIAAHVRGGEANVCGRSNIKWADFMRRKCEWRWGAAMWRRISWVARKSRLPVIGGRHLWSDGHLRRFRDSPTTQKKCASPGDLESMRHRIRLATTGFLYSSCRQFRRTSSCMDGRTISDDDASRTATRILSAGRKPLRRNRK